MKQLNREKIQRMIEGRGSSGGSGGGGGSMAGYASQAWVDQNYISIEFFGRLFKAYHPASTSGQPDEEVLPNDLESTITNIKAKFGLWTEQYLSALGQGSGGGGGGASSLADLVDVTITNPQTNQALLYDGNGHWVNGSITPDLSAYATKAWVQQQGYITSSALNGYATQTWVTQNFLGANDTAAAATKLANARTLWGQSFNGTADVSGNMSSVGHMSFSNNETRFTPNGGYTDPAPGDNYAFKFGGTLAATAILSSGYVAALSDIRLKKVINRINLKPEAIAMASIIRYRWKDGHDEMVHVGGIAQEWQELLPDAVVTCESGHLSMDYSVIAYASVVSLARTVVNQQHKIDKLEKRLAKIEPMFALKDEEE